MITRAAEKIYLLWWQALYFFSSQQHSDLGTCTQTELKHSFWKTAQSNL